MPTPTQRLETRKTTMECRVCAWLVTLPDRDRREWEKAIANPRFGAGLVASEITVDMDNAEYQGDRPGESSVHNHRTKRH